MFGMFTVVFRALWRHVKIDVDEDEEFEEVIDKYCNAGAGTAEALHILVHSDFCNEDHMVQMATIFKKLNKLHYSNLFHSLPRTSTTSWLALPEPWTSLEELHLDCWLGNGQLFRWFHNDDIRDVDLHLSFPNLTSLEIELTCDDYCKVLQLPDLRGCERLKSFSLHSDSKVCVSFQYDLKSQVS